MSAKIIDGKKIADSLLAKVKKEVTALKQAGVEPMLAVILVGKNSASALYVEKKEKACEQLGIKSMKIELDEKLKEGELVAKVRELNTSLSVHGILVQLPLPEHINQQNVLNTINPLKDVDGFHAFNLGLLAHGEEPFVSCTAKGIVKLIESTGKSIKGSDVCIVNHSVVVGKPLALMLLNREATVTVCHRFTKDLAEHTRKADILVTAVGRPGLIRGEMVKAGAVVIDAGIARKDKVIAGDVDFRTVSNVASHISPVPGGVGPMTVACLMQNTVRAAVVQRK